MSATSSIAGTGVLGSAERAVALARRARRTPPDRLRAAAVARLRSRGAGLLPAGSPRGTVARAALQSAREARAFRRSVGQVWRSTGLRQPAEPDYARWCSWHDASREDLRHQRAVADGQRSAARVLVVVTAPAAREGAADAAPADPALLDPALLDPALLDPALLDPALLDPALLDRTLRSLRAQSWPHWDAVVCTSGGALPVDGRLAADLRVTAAPPGPPLAAADAAVRACGAEMVVLLQAGESLAPDALYCVADAIHRDPLVDLVTWDDDLLVGRARTDPRFRPSWSPDALLGSNYPGRSWALRRRRWLEAGGLRDVAASSGALDGVVAWDLLLRCELSGEQVARVPRVLGHLSSRDEGVRPAGARVVQDHLDRIGLAATAEVDGASVRLVWPTAGLPPVTVVICTRHNRPMLERCLPSLATTDYPTFDVVVVDNGEQPPDASDWYAKTAAGLDLTVEPWTEPFNYSAVNNRGATLGRGEVLVFLNDDTEVLDPAWLRELVGWARRPEIGVAGLQLIGPDGELQHAGAVLGLGGFADHVFQGMPPGSPSLLGPTGWYRDVLAVTGACLAVRREVFERVGGFDERFLLCGSDVALGLDTHLVGLRNVCSPYAAVRHLESATRGTHVPVGDFFASYWRYSPYLFGGDPYFSPNLSLGSRMPRLKHPDEPTPAQRIAGPLGRSFTVFRQRSDEAESRMLAGMCRARPQTTAAVEALHAQHAEPFQVRTVNWFIPDIDSPFYGGINTALRLADQLARVHGVQNRFVVWGSPPDHFVRSALAAAFPSLADSPIHFYDGSADALADLPEADAAVATLWLTAYAVAHFPHAKRKFYLVQDFEPMFYPASTLYALAEESYRLGLYALCNTHNMREIYAGDYGGKAMSFVPAVDPAVFHARTREERPPGSPVTVFVYARPGHWRNCWELASLALEELKDRLGDRVRIVTAGSWAVPEPGFGGMHHHGLLDYRATGELYRRCDVGLALTVSKHPSYLPLELMACGVPVVAFDNPWGHWVLRDGDNALLAKRTADDLAAQLERLVVDDELRTRLRGRALETIAEAHADWESALAPVYPYLCDPEGPG